MSTEDAVRLDGNAAAGELGQVFVADLTVALGQCAGCGRTGELAAAHLYSRAPGLVLRCPGCDGVLLRLVRASGRTWLDMQGIACLQLDTP